MADFMRVFTTVFGFSRGGFLQALLGYCGTLSSFQWGVRCLRVLAH